MTPVDMITVNIIKQSNIGNVSMECSKTSIITHLYKNLYYHSPHFDLKSWTIDNIDTKNAGRSMQRR